LSSTSASLARPFRERSAQRAETRRILGCNPLLAQQSTANQRKRVLQPRRLGIAADGAPQGLAPFVGTEVEPRQGELARATSS